MERVDPELSVRYADASFEEVLIWTDQVWSCRSARPQAGHDVRGGPQRSA
jgi:hypothetical protein